MAWTIYCHIHIESGRRYIGLTKRTWQERWRGHVCNAKRYHTHFAHAIVKYGQNAFSHQVLETCVSLEEANEAEAAWIESFSTRFSEFGFNLIKGGSHTPHPVKKDHWSDPEYRAAASARSKARWNDPTSRAQNVAATRKAKQEPAERARSSEASKKLWADSQFRERMSLIQKVSHARPEVKAKESAVQMGKVLSQNHRQRIGDAFRGKPLSSEHRASVSSSLQGRTFTTEHCANISKAQKGRVLSAETRAKIGAAAKKSNACRKKSDTTLIAAPNTEQNGVRSHTSSDQLLHGSDRSVHSDHSGSDRPSRS